MEKKATLGLSALFIIGIVYTILGSVFIVLGASFGAFGTNEDTRLLGIIFPIIGGVFFVLGIVFLAVEWKKLQRANALIAAGRYIWGELVEFQANLNVRINGRHPYIAIVRYADPYGAVHIFHSRSLRIYPDPAAIGRRVKVYISDNTFRHYYVDMDGVLPPVTEH